MGERRARVLGTSSKNAGDDAVLRAVIPVGRSGLALAAGYLGLCSFLVVPAPLALVISIVAIVDLAKNREKRGWGRAIFGLLMGGFFSWLFLVWIFK